MKPLDIGITLARRVRPTALDTASAIGNTGIDVVSTAALVAFLEHTCHLLIEPAYEADEASVGTHIELEHQKPALPHQPLELAATLCAVDGKRCRFSVEVSQAGRSVIKGTHTRYCVNIERFASRARANDPAPSVRRETLDFWFDFNSPWCFLASLRIAAIANRHRSALRWRPVHLARLIERVDGRRVLEENAAFVNWYQKDLQDWASLAGVVLRYHPRYPLRPSRALRLALHAADTGCAHDFVVRVMRAYWSHGEDISNEEVLVCHARAAGMDPADAREALSADVYKTRLDQNLETAVASGVFGLPTVACGSKLFFGNDRLDMLEQYLVGRL